MESNIKEKKLGKKINNWIKYKEERDKLGYNEILGISTGFQTLDEETDGFNKKEYWIIGGESGIGKTSFALNLALNVAEKGYVIFYFITEMGDYRLVEKILGITTKINTKLLRRAKLENFIQEIVDECRRLSKLKIYIFAGEVFSTNIVENVLKSAMKLDVPLKPDVIFIDYIQQTLEAQRISDWVQGLSNASFCYQKIAKEYDVCVVALSQISKEGQKEYSKKGKVEAYALKGSSTLKQNADVVLLLERKKDNPTDLRIKIDKVRFGEEKIINAYFNCETGYIAEINYIDKDVMEDEEHS